MDSRSDSEHDGEIIRPSTVADIPSLSLLFEEVFKTPREPALWKWKYFEREGSTGFVCERGKRIVAHCGGVIVEIEDGSRRYQAFQSVDFMSSPSYAGGLGAGGVFARTVQSFFRAHCGPGLAELVYGFPGERHRLLGERILGYRPVERVGELRLAGDGPRGEIARLTENHLDRFHLSSAGPGVVRDPGYLRWRYMRHPRHDYGFVAVPGFFGLGRGTAAIVRQTDEALLLMEITEPRSDRSLRDLTRELASHGLPVVYWGSPEHPLTERLIRCGFKLEERDHWLECRFFVERPPFRPGEFHFTLGDYDVH